jgi:hypothetical protein
MGCCASRPALDGAASAGSPAIFLDSYAGGFIPSARKKFQCWSTQPGSPPFVCSRCADREAPTLAQWLDDPRSQHFRHS